QFSRPRPALSSVFAAAVLLGTLIVTLNRTALRCHWVMLKDFALEYPDLHTADTVSGLRFCCTVVDISTQRVKRNATFTIPFHTRDFDNGTAEAQTAYGI